MEIGSVNPKPYNFNINYPIEILEGIFFIEYQSGVIYI